MSSWTEPKPWTGPELEATQAGTRSAQPRPGLQYGAGGKMDRRRVGYQNDNQQVILDRLGRSVYGGLPPKAYRMHCLDCGSTHAGPRQALPSRACPECQGGKWGPELTSQERPQTVDARRVDVIKVLQQALEQGSR